MPMSDSSKSPDPDDPLQYGVLGEDTSTTSDKLDKYTGEVDWKYLEKHYEAGAMLYVDPSLDLVEVGKAISEDDADAVSAWKKSGDLVQPSAPHALFWEDANPKCLALVVSPFVLAQPIES